MHVAQLQHHIDPEEPGHVSLLHHTMKPCCGGSPYDDGGVVCREEANLGEVIYPRGSISELPEAHASRKERFTELDDLQPGWEVELRGRKGGTTVDAFFFSPTGVFDSRDCVASCSSVRHHAG